MGEPELTEPETEPTEPPTGRGRPRRWRFVLTAAVTAALVGLGLWWFGDDAPLGDGGGFGLCAPVAAGGSVTLGEVPLRNRGGSPVTLTAARLVKPRNVELVDAVILPIEWEAGGYIDQDGTFEGIELVYRSGLRSYTYRVDSEVRLRVLSETCEDAPDEV